MAKHAHTTSPLLRSTAGAPPPLLCHGADRQPGPVTCAIRNLRPNELPSWELRQRQMDEEAKALRDLRRRVAKAVSDGIALLDALDGDPDLEADDDDEPSLCGAVGDPVGALTPSTALGDDREEDAGDEPEEENEHGSDCDREGDDEVDREPSLGSLGGTASSFGLHGFGMVAEQWDGGQPGDLEAVDEDRDEADDEPVCSLEWQAAGQELRAGLSSLISCGEAV